MLEVSTYCIEDCLKIHVLYIYVPFFCSINVCFFIPSVPNGSFSQFFIRFNSRLSDVSTVNDKDYQTAVLEADVRI